MSSPFDIRHVVNELRRRGAPQLVIDDVIKGSGREGVHDLGDGNVVCTDFGPRSVVLHGTVNGTGSILIVEEWVIDAPKKGWLPAPRDVGGRTR